ncbi:MAG: TonB-dependent receptor domain-containing protein, partial [Blastocatellia bacterium]
VQDIPLNGRHFVDLGLLIPGTVTPPQGGFLTAPLRGQGSFAFNTAGNREDTTNFMVNGVNLNDMFQNQITFQPSISTVAEFKVDNSTFNAEYGRNSGSIVNIATRSGTNGWHGEAFEFLRNDLLDARNFFTRLPATKAEFRRNQFGANVGGAIKKDKAFFFFSYEGVRQRQGVPLNSGVLSDAQRAGVTDPSALQLLQFIPHANSTINGNSAFVGAASAPVNIDQWTLDMSYNIGANDHLHGYYVFQRDLRNEPTLQGNTIPGFGDTRQSHRQIFTLNEIHTFGSSLVNEARLGFNRIFITFSPVQALNPATLGINEGVNQNIALPQITISDISLNFGGPAGFPQGRGDTTAIASDTASWLHGKHSISFGGEFRTFLNNNFLLTAGTLTFATTPFFQQGKVTAFANTIGAVTNSLATKSVGLFVTDSYKIMPGLTLDLGLRYDVNTPPSERFNRYVVFDPATDSLVNTGHIYDTNSHNFQPRVGFAWDPFKNGKTVVRGAYAILYDQPVTNSVTGATGNPPLASPVAAQSNAGLISLDNPLASAAASGLAPSTINQRFKEPYVQNWNLNVQHEITATLGIMVGYFGSKGTHLRISDNLNQIVSGVRPFPTLSLNSPILPGSRLNNISNIDGVGNSSYNALWATANKRLGHGLQFNASYTFSKSLDYNSLSSQGVVVQDSNNLRNDRGLSDYNATHRFVINWIYDLPFKGNRVVEGWRLSAITQWQTGNPINLFVSGLSGFTGNTTIRPDVIGPIHVTGDPTQWFTNVVCDPRLGPCAANAVFAIPVSASGAFHFGDLARNAIIGPGFSDSDFSVAKTTKIHENYRIEFRADFFDIFNQANFGQPGAGVALNSTTFGVVTNTRFQPGDSGSSRQIQFALKFMF